VSGCRAKVKIIRQIGRGCGRDYGSWGIPVGEWKAEAGKSEIQKYYTDTFLITKVPYCTCPVNLFILKKFTQTCLFLGALTSAVLAANASGWGLLSLLAAAFVLLPYGLLFILYQRAFKGSTEIENRVPISILCFLTAALNIIFYFNASFSKPSSTSGLAFAVIPIYSISFICVGYFFGEWISKQLK
jgi:hypothetical protein